MNSPNPSTRLWLIRHGETDWNAAQRIQGRTDISLNATGEQQAQCVAEYLSQHTIHAIYSSDLSRAIQTASPLANRLGIKVCQDAAFAERDFGIFQGLTADEIAKAYPTDYDRWQSREPAFAPAGGESLSLFQARVEAAIAGLVQQHSGDSVAVVTHGGFLDMVYRLGFGLPMEQARDWKIPNAGIQEAIASSTKIDILCWAMVAHLDPLAVRDEVRGFS
jgi:probable phosphoglycerate mutase